LKKLDEIDSKKRERENERNGLEGTVYKSKDLGEVQVLINQIDREK
jgi:hypothetical protein